MRKFSVGSTIASIGSALVLATIFTACSAPEVPMQPAEDANDPACANVIVRLPDEISEHERRRTNAQSTGAWGDPTAILLRCGIVPSGPTTLDCVNVNGIDWIIDRENAPMVRFEAYGREPGLEVIVDSEKVGGTDTVLALNNTVAQLKQVRECSNLTDELNFNE